MPISVTWVALIRPIPPTTCWPLRARRSRPNSTAPASGSNSAQVRLRRQRGPIARIITTSSSMVLPSPWRRSAEPTRRSTTQASRTRCTSSGSSSGTTMSINGAQRQRPSTGSSRAQVKLWLRPIRTRRAARCCSSATPGRSATGIWVRPLAASRIPTWWPRTTTSPMARSWLGISALNIMSSRRPGTDW